MKKNLITIFSAFFIFALFAVFSNAQERDAVRSIAGSQYVISAQAGGVNLTIGEVLVQRKNLTSGYLVKGDTLEVGDRVMTAAGAKTEVLLNPGSYVRLGGNAEFEFVTTDLDDLQLKLNRGSAMFEVYASNDFRVTVVAPGSRFYLIKSGVYRVDVLGNGTSRIEVRKGKAQIGDFEATSVKKSRSAVVEGNDVAIEKFDRDERDDLEAWSRDRAKELAKANASLERDRLRSTLWNGYRSSSWDTFNSYGLWTYSPSLGSYCFLPFGYGWRSPYGFGLNRDLYYFRLPTVVYYMPTVKPRRNPNPGDRPTGNPGQVGNPADQAGRPGGRGSGTPPIDGARRRPWPSGERRVPNPSGQPRGIEPSSPRQMPNPGFPRSFPQQPTRQVDPAPRSRTSDSTPAPTRSRSMPVDQ
ncbi:MAG: FecR domain-containing protein [Pyrinomonadaceae bacterium]